MKNVNIKLRNLKLTSVGKEKEGYGVFKYIYINRSLFGLKNDPPSSNLFLKTVLKKALQFYEKDNYEKFYEWVFKFRNYIKLLERDFTLGDIERFYII